MAVDQFIKIEGIDGESKDDAHTDEIDVLAWSWGLSQSGSFHVGGGGGSGKVDVQDISFTKYVDKASPVLTKYCCNGKHIPEAILTVRKSGENPLEYITITLTKVIISSITHGGSASDERLTENVTLNFAQVKYEYQPQDDAGAADGGKIEMGWDIEANVPL